MKGYKLVKEHQGHFDIKHPDGSVFQVAKHALSLGMMSQLAKMPKHMDEGGDTSMDAPESYYGAPSLPSNPFSFGQDNPYPDLTGQQAPAQSQMGPPAAPVEVPQTDVSQTPPPGMSIAATDPTGIAIQNQPQIAAPPDQSQDPRMQDYGIQGAADSQKKALQEEADARKTAAQSQQDILAAQQNDLKSRNETFEKRMADFDSQNQAIQQGISSNKIDPNRIWNNADTGSKIGMAISLIIGGMGSGGRADNNAALNVMNNAISRDIDAQKANLGTQKSLLEANFQGQHNMMAAENATRINMLQAVKGQLDSAAAKGGGGIAQARADQAKAGIDQQLAQLHQGQAMFMRAQSMFGPGAAGGNGTQPDGVDVNRLRAMSALSGTPGAPSKEDFGKTMDEYQKYQKMTSLVDNLHDAYDQVDKLQNAGDRLNPLNAYQSRAQINKIKAEYSAQLAKALEGRATPQDIDSFMEQFPGLLENKTTRATGLNNMENSIKAEFGKFPYMTSTGVLNPNNPYIQTTADVKNKFKKIGSMASK